MKTTALAAALLATTLAACTSTAPTTVANNKPEPTILMVPVQINDPQLASGCWAQLYTSRDFKGDFVTLVGPAEVESMDKGTARQLKRDIDSLSVGPRATLQVFEKAMFRDRVVSFPANSREAGLVRRLGFGGGIQAMRLSCS